MRKILYIYFLMLLCPLGVAAQVVSPILGDMWRHQSSPFNALCPKYDGSAERCEVGCVATAVESVVSYYNRTITLADTLHGWTTEHYTIDDVLPGSSVDCSLILPRYDEGQYTQQHANEVAKLSYWLGMACKMQWGISSSGAHVYRLEEPLRDVFGMKYVHYADSYNYRPADWKAMIYQELRAGRPVAFAGYAMSMSGHAFVLDGIDAEGNVHVNWGYGGAYDGWYDLSRLNFAEVLGDLHEDDLTEGLFCNQELIFLHPDAQDVTLPDTIARTGQEIVVDSIRIESDIIAHKHSPVMFYFRNTSAEALTTPMFVFSNEAERTDSLIYYGDYAAFAGRTIEGGARDSLLINLLFDESGERILRVTCDGQSLVYEHPITILPQSASNLTFTAPEIAFSADGTAINVTTEVTNSGVQRAGQRLIFCLSSDGEWDGDVRHVRYLHTPAGKTEVEEMSFSALTPGKTYWLRLRSPWKPVVTDVKFTMPVPEGVAGVECDAQEDAATYDLQGRRVDNTCRGIVVKKGAKVLRR